ncbi:glycosyltransferase family 4 protein [Aquirhabdus parva]|uniref:Glycosyltransferase subfamily 4-like N-terminal domain-containing protein n=1 Tax=Aquirhabdus parva TaxID=2283318 RepID=A0A345P5Y2_9GAMM|nr:glycosyltransferase family 4 protein [Aquirhabdus parva]AXI02691.1 hypothetical protein HYN46_07510 [Aquirhabdus parva]
MASILMTNLILAERSGTEIATVELAYALKGRGHRVAIYSPSLGPTAHRARVLGIPVTNRIESIGFVPDIIHGHHNTALTVALIRFPKTPAIFVCHDSSTPYDAAPPLVSRIGAYIAIDHACRDRMVLDGVPDTKIQIIANAVNLDLFKPRIDYAITPKSALVVTKLNTDYVAEIKKACDLRGIELSVVGVGVGKVVDDLAIRFQKADVVFGYSRSAIEAAATGAMVIMTDGSGYGGILSSNMIEEWPNCNLGRRHFLNKHVSSEDILTALDSYNVEELKKISYIVREKVDLNALALKWETLYEEVISSPKRLVNPAHDDALLASYVAHMTFNVAEKYSDDDMERYAVYRFDAANPRLKTLVGKKTKSALTTTGVAGFLLFGPYIPLKNGYYRVKIFGNITFLNEQDYVDVTIERGMKKLIKVPLSHVPSSDLIVDIPLYLNESATDIEIRINVSADSRLEVYSIEISPVDHELQESEFNLNQYIA